MTLKKTVMKETEEGKTMEQSVSTKMTIPSAAKEKRGHIGKREQGNQKKEPDPRFFIRNWRGRGPETAGLTVAKGTMIQMKASQKFPSAPGSQVQSELTGRILRQASRSPKLDAQQ